MIRYVVPAVGFTQVSLASFSLWAFGGGKWFSSPGSLYTACAVVFLVLGGFSLLPFSGTNNQAVNWKILWMFPLSFLSFAGFWCIGWFTFPNHFGEIMGSALGIITMTALLKLCLRIERPAIEMAAVVFLCYTLGYYLGEKVYGEVGGLAGKLGWGLGFGGGLGFGLTYLIQQSLRSKN